MSVSVDVFREVRERVSAEDAAQNFGLVVRQNHMALCPFHQEKTPSLSFKNGLYRCFGCGAHGNSIDYTVNLLGVSPIDAVKRLNQDFRLGLPLDNKPDAAAQAAARRRAQERETRMAFERWQEDAGRMMNACLLAAHTVSVSSWDEMTAQDVLALKERPRIEYFSDLLLSDSMEDKMQVFRCRKEIEHLCEQILIPTITRSKTD